MKKFIDVYHEDKINWDKIKSQGWEGAFLKVSDGTTIYSDWAKEQVEKLNTLSIPFGFYHWIQPLINVDKQISAFTSAVPGINPSLGWALDVEPTFIHRKDMWGTLINSTGHNQPAVKLTVFLNGLKAINLNQIYIYTTNSFWQTMIWDDADKDTQLKLSASLVGVKQWIARYPFNSFKSFDSSYSKYTPQRLAGFVDSPWAWQYSDKAPIGGIAECDVNVVL